MLTDQRIPMNEAERAAVDELLEGEPVAALTRTEAEESGPIRVEIPGRAVYLVSEDGTTTEEEAG